MFNNKKIHFFCSVFALMLCVTLVFSLVANNLIELHEHVSVHNETACNENTELDACHRFLIHHEKSEACDGSHTHIGSKHNECFACKYTKERQHDISLASTTFKVSFPPLEFFEDITSPSSYFSLSNYQRGPPSFIS